MTMQGACAAACACLSHRSGQRRGHSGPRWRHRRKLPRVHSVGRCAQALDAFNEGKELNPANKELSDRAREVRRAAWWRVGDGDGVGRWAALGSVAATAGVQQRRQRLPTHRNRCRLASG